MLSAYTLATQKIDPIMLLELSPKRLREAGRGGKKYASVAGRETEDERGGERERESSKGRAKLQKSKSSPSRNNCNHSRCQNPLDPSSLPDGNFSTGLTATEKGAGGLCRVCVRASAHAQLVFYTNSALL